MAKTYKLTAWDLAALENLVNKEIDSPRVGIQMQSLVTLQGALASAKSGKLEG